MFLFSFFFFPNIDPFNWRLSIHSLHEDLLSSPLEQISSQHELNLPKKIATFKEESSTYHLLVDPQVQIDRLIMF